MRNHKIDLISWKRILGTFAVQAVATDEVGKYFYSDNYHVNLNSLLD